MANNLISLADYYNGLKKQTLARRFFFNLFLTPPPTLGVEWSNDYNSLIKDVNIPGVSQQAASFNNTTELTESGLSYTFTAPGTYSPSRKEFEIKFLDTENSLIDNVFYPWMLYAISSSSFKDDYTANMQITFYNGDSTSESLICTILKTYPIICDTPNASHQNQGIYERGVTFRCDSVVVTSKSTTQVDPNFVNNSIKYLQSTLG